jgi:hypothetical protein
LKHGNILFSASVPPIPQMHAETPARRKKVSAWIFSRHRQRRRFRPRIVRWVVLEDGRLVVEAGFKPPGEQGCERTRLWCLGAGARASSGIRRRVVDLDLVAG